MWKAEKHRLFKTLTNSTHQQTIPIHQVHIHQSRCINPHFFQPSPYVKSVALYVFNLLFIFTSVQLFSCPPPPPLKAFLKQIKANFWLSFIPILELLYLAFGLVTLQRSISLDILILSSVFVLLDKGSWSVSSPPSCEHSRIILISHRSFFPTECLEMLVGFPPR